MIREASKNSIHTLLMLGLAWWIVFYGSEMLEQSFYSNAISYSSMGSLMLGKIFVIACGFVLSTYSSYHFFGMRKRRFASSILVSLMMVLPKYESMLSDFDRINFVVESEVVKLDDLSGVNLKTLHDHLNKLRDEDRVEIIARVYDWSPEAYSSLMRHSFKVEKLDCSWCD